MVKITAVDPHGRAASAGILAGDVLINEIGRAHV